MTEHIAGAIARARPDLVPNWRAVLARGWSVWSMYVGIAMQVADWLLPLRGILPMPALVTLAFALAIVLRIIKQRDLSGDRP